MNERDKELALQAWTENDWEGYLNIKKLIALIRADEREACAKILESISNAPDMASYAAAIRARGNT